MIFNIKILTIFTLFELIINFIIHTIKVYLSIFNSILNIYITKISFVFKLKKSLSIPGPLMVLCELS